MAFLGKNYTLYKQENFDGFLKFSGLPDDKIKAVASFKSAQKLVQNGDSYTYHTQNLEGPKETTFKSGVEFDDVLGPEKTPIKTKYVVDGNSVIQTITTDKGAVVFKREYNGDELVVTITADGWDGVAKRFYKA